ncbi:hypothetical protein JKP88DRAFT_160751 [Tribonema minus]|uniref:U-box domain-containing protein n=1 Tax=Tribonema minus TaxID=303371 RepID=A0A835ZFQ8_9STRA|nr:hypothetical protein JKP88DRAFT_160751 [Tribonema minus]
MGRPASGLQRSQASNNIRLAARCLREKFGESTRSFVAQGIFIITRLRNSRPDALELAQGKKLVAYVNEGQLALACLPLFETGRIEERFSLSTLEGTLRKISEARMALLHATKKRSRCNATSTSAASRARASYPPATGRSVSDGEAELEDAHEPITKRRRNHTYGGGEGARLAKMAAEADASCKHANAERPADQRAEDDVKQGPVVTKLRAAGVAVPSEFVCPLTGDVMREPVLLTGDQRHYDSKACAKWLISNSVSPSTGEPLGACSFMVPAHALRQRIAAFVEEHASVLSVTVTAQG